MGVPKVGRVSSNQDDLAYSRNCMYSFARVTITTTPRHTLQGIASEKGGITYLHSKIHAEPRITITMEISAARREREARKHNKEQRETRSTARLESGIDGARESTAQREKRKESESVRVCPIGI